MEENTEDEYDDAFELGRIAQSRTQSPRSSRSRNEGLWHNPFVFSTNRGDPVLLRMCKVFQDGGHANRKYTLYFNFGKKI